MDASVGALAPYTVLDLTARDAWLTGRVLADLGADVVRLAAPDEDLAGDADAWAFQRGKRAVAVDLGSAHDRAQVLAAVAGVDAIIESSGPGGLESLGLAPKTLHEINPRLVVTRVSAFGQDGPRASERADDLVLAAVSGLLWMTGDPDRPPVRVSVPHLFLHAAMEAAVHTIAALTHAAVSGAGQTVDVSAQLCAMRALGRVLSSPGIDGSVPARMGFGGPRPGQSVRSLYTCADGHALLAVRGARDLATLAKWMREETGVAVEDTDAATVERAFAAHAQGHTKADLAQRALERRLGLVPVHTVADILNDEQLHARGQFETLAVDQLELRVPARWAHLSRTPLRASAELAPPLRGETGALALAALAERRAVADASWASAWTPDAAEHALYPGLRVWDASWVGVGPLTARYLGDYGATVVHSETASRPDMLRGMPPFRDGRPGLNRSQFFAECNASKFGLGLDFSTPGGHRVAVALAGWADVVVESFTPGVLARRELSYEYLAAHNPSLIMLSTTMNGQTGPKASFAGFGTDLVAVSGFCEVTGWDDRPPGSPPGPYTDFLAQRFAAAALLAAIDHRRRTGEGQYIDVSQYEASLQYLAPAILDYTASGRIARRVGNRDRQAAPHGVFPCRATAGSSEAWVAISVCGEVEWGRLRKVLADDALADERFDTLAGRKQHEDELERRVAAWTTQHSRDEIVRMLQPGVRAGAVLDAADLQTDPQVRHRGFFVTLPHPEMGPTSYERAQAALERTQPHPRRAAPCLGEHTRTVLETLGFSADEVEELELSGAVESYRPTAVSAVSASPQPLPPPSR